MTSPPPPSGIVTLLTDFGTQDPFVGTMKGVLLARFPAARIVDLTHGVAAQDVVEGGFWLARSFGFFPVGTVHVAVVDPGVGTSRRPIVASAGGHYFVGPDNGLFSDVIAGAGSVEARVIDVGRFALRKDGAIALSRTFHGRDLFAPTAAALASGLVAFDQIGPLAGTIAVANAPPVVADAQRAEGVIVTIDRFGNLLTNIEASHVEALGDRLVARLGDHTIELHGTYGDVDVGRLVAVTNSFGVVEIARRGGSAAEALTATRGLKVVVERSG